MAFELMPLPYAADALEPYVSARTFEFHHGKHHRAYVDKMNAAIAGTPKESMDLVAVVRAAKAEGNQALFNNAGQTFNHNFLWQSFTPDKTAPSERMRSLLDRDLGGVEGFNKRFKDEAVGHFASGWAWLVMRGDRLDVISTHDADSAIAHDGVEPLLVLDLWEHAYYLDYQNRRPDFVESFLANTINWKFAEANLDGSGEARGNE